MKQLSTIIKKKSNSGEPEVLLVGRDDAASPEGRLYPVKNRNVKTVENPRVKSLFLINVSRERKRLRERAEIDKRLGETLTD